MKRIKTLILLAVMIAGGQTFQAFGQQTTSDPTDRTKLQGTWEITQITVKKNTDGKEETSVYNAANEVKSYIRCPQTWEIGDSSIVQRYADGWEETSRYVLEGNRLTIHAADAPQSFEYTLNNAILTLQATHNYLNNLRSGQTEHIEEEWSIDLKKQ